MKGLRSSFGQDALNATCAGCDMYRDLEFYRTRDGRSRAELNRARAEGKEAKARPAARRAFIGG